MRNSKQNDTVMRLIEDNYKYLTAKCPNHDYFVDTLLFMSYKYREGEDFVQQFLTLYSYVAHARNIEECNYRHIERAPIPIKKCNTNNVYNYIDDND